jgi:protein-S-isoprenylcysteine O-methyltransferase Ste14
MQVTNGIFAFNRNPIYTAFALVLIGQFMIFPNWIMLALTAAAFWLFHCHVLCGEEFLKAHYGQVFLDYYQRVRRYLQSGISEDSDAAKNRDEQA